MSERALEDAGRLLARRVGLRLDPAIRGRLARAVRDEAQRAGSDEAAYVARLDNDPDLMQDLLNRVTVQETSFFRDAGQFVALADLVLPELRATGRPVRIWSAGCANGQESYSLAMTLAESGITDWGVIASDISTDALARTRRARYAERELRGLSAARRQRFLVATGKEHEIVSELRERVTVVRHNLAADQPPFSPDECQVVFCRNVLIYFRHDDVVAFLDRLAARVPASAYLFLGYSESLWQVTDRFQLTRLGDAFAYRPGRAAEVERRTPPAPKTKVATAATRRPRPEPKPEQKVTAGAPSAPPPTSPVAPAPGSMELMAVGEEALGRGDHAAAITAFRRATFVDPDHPVAHLNLGLALEVSGDDAAARRAYAAARAALDRCDTAAVETTLEGYHLDELVRLLEQKQAAG